MLAQKLGHQISEQTVDNYRGPQKLRTLQNSGRSSRGPFAVGTLFESVALFVRAALAHYVDAETANPASFCASWRLLGSNMPLLKNFAFFHARC